MDLTSLDTMHQTLVELREHVLQLANEKAESLNGLKERVEGLVDTVNHMEEQRIILAELKKNKRVNIEALKQELKDAKNKIKEYL